MFNEDIKKYNLYMYSNLFIIVGLIPLSMRLSGVRFRSILIFLEFIFVSTYLYLSYKRVGFINNKITNKKKISFNNYFVAISGAIIMTIAEGFVYRGTGKINFLVIILSIIPSIPMINLEDNIKKRKII